MEKITSTTNSFSGWSRNFHFFAHAMKRMVPFGMHGPKKDYQYQTFRNGGFGY